MNQGNIGDPFEQWDLDKLKTPRECLVLALHQSKGFSIEAAENFVAILSDEQIEVFLTMSELAPFSRPISDQPTSRFL